MLVHVLMAKCSMLELAMLDQHARFPVKNMADFFGRACKNAGYRVNQGENNNRGEADEKWSAIKDHLTGQPAEHQGNQQIERGKLAHLAFAHESYDKEHDEVDGDCVQNCGENGITHPLS